MEANDLLARAVAMLHEIPPLVATGCYDAASVIADRAALYYRFALPWLDESLSAAGCEASERCCELVAALDRGECVGLADVAGAVVALIERERRLLAGEAEDLEEYNDAAEETA